VRGIRRAKSTSKPFSVFGFFSSCFRGSCHEVIVLSKAYKNNRGVCKQSALAS